MLLQAEPVSLTAAKFGNLPYTVESQSQSCLLVEDTLERDERPEFVICAARDTDMLDFPEQELFSSERTGLAAESEPGRNAGEWVVPTHRLLAPGGLEDLKHYKNQVYRLVARPVG